ncbi:MAG: YeeE/YedE family protein [Alicyclobacillus sp.]|nr:YeeE/YedE family protein [Alicyclobacillus sp.]
MSTPELHLLDLDTPGKLAVPEQSRIHWPVVILSLAVFAVGFAVIQHASSPSHALLFLVAGVLGAALYHAHFGFTSSFRRLLVGGRGIGIRAQMVMFALANLLMLPLFVHGSALGHAIKGNVYPVGLSVLVGSFLFGLGMQLGDGCASGTLYHTGGGDARGILTLAGFVAGSLLGTLNYTWWMKTPSFQPVSLVQTFGPTGGLLLNLVIMAFVFAVAWSWEKRRHGQVEPLFAKQAFRWKSVLTGPWSLVAGGVVLALGNFVITLVSGKPWGVTSAFALWGAKIAVALGVPVDHWGYWQTAANAATLHQSLLQHLETTDDVAIMVGALLAAKAAPTETGVATRPAPLLALASLVRPRFILFYLLWLVAFAVAVPGNTAEEQSQAIDAIRQRQQFIDDACH